METIVKPKIVLIGPCGGGGIPKNGASAKNYHLSKFLQDRGVYLKIIDTEKWRKNPIILFDLFFTILFNPKAKFIVATDNMSGYRTMKAFSLFPRKRHVIYWIIGGSIANWIKEGKVDANAYKIVNTFIVEGVKMQKTFAECGFHNTIYVPNFKYVGSMPKKLQKRDKFVKFVFLSRIIPQKGCRMILNAVKQLNATHGMLFSVDFYGPIDDSYKNEFTTDVATLFNVNYKGFLDLRITTNYNELSKYDIMLFPTYWDGEGFPGIAIDSFIAGLPVIATDWSLNSDIIDKGITGIVLPVRLRDGINSSLLASGEIPFDENEVTRELIISMKYFIENPSCINLMSKSCQIKARDYDINNVLTIELFQQLGINL